MKKKKYIFISIKLLSYSIYLCVSIELKTITFNYTGINMGMINQKDLFNDIYLFLTGSLKIHSKFYESNRPNRKTHIIEIEKVNIL